MFIARIQHYPANNHIHHYPSQHIENVNNCPYLKQNYGLHGINANETENTKNSKQAQIRTTSVGNLRQH